MGSERGKFVKVVCVRCGNEQIVYGKASTRVKCLKCNKLLVKSGGGKTQIKTLIREVLGL
jgi:small subunit ribosomal protein S27e